MAVTAGINMRDIPLIRDMQPGEAAPLGRLLVEVYSALEDFPSPQQHPDYYAMLANVGSFASMRGVRVLTATAQPAGTLLGGVVYIGDMSTYGSGGAATRLPDASGIRLLGVRPAARNAGVGRLLTSACIDIARTDGNREVILHTTLAMRAAWHLYTQLGFIRSEDLDFMQGDLPVFGFKLSLERLHATANC